MNFTKKQNIKHLKVVVLLVLILSICIITAWLIFKKYYLAEMVHTRIEQQLNEQIDNKFQYIPGNITLSLMSSEAQLIGLNFLWLNEADTVGYLKGDIRIDFNSPRNLLFDKQKRIKHIALNNLELYYVDDHPLVMKDKADSGNRELKVENVSAIGKLRTANKHNEQSGQLTAEFNISAALDYNSTDELKVDHLLRRITKFQLSQLHYYLPDGFYRLMIEEAVFDDFNDIALKQVTINPIYSRKNFAIKKKKATDYISVSMDSIRIIDFDERLSERIFIDQINVYQPNIDVYKDRNYPDDMGYKAVLVDLLQELKMPVYIRAAEITEMFIKYTELAEEAKEAGSLFFSEANAKISNITNVEDSVRKSENMLIEAEAELYGRGKVNTTMSYELLSKTGQFNIKGSLTPMDIVEVNAIISKLLPVEIESGSLDKLYFNFWGTRIHSKGEMWFEYSNLNIELTEINYLDNRFTRNVLNSIGNQVLRNSNPASNGTFRVGAIKQERDTTKSMFNYWWISLKSGFLSTLGVTDAKQLINYNSGKDATLLDRIGLGSK